MMRKFFLQIWAMIFCLIFAFTAVSFATEDIPTDVTEEDGGVEISENEGSDVAEEVPPTYISSGNDCLCGREYHTETTAEHSKYDCIKCGKNMYACTCNCWCGAASVLDTSGLYGSISPRLCSGCNLPCPDCTCRTDKAEVLAAEKLRINGEVSPLNIPRPESGVSLFIALVFVLLLTGAAVFLPYASFLKKKNSVPEEKVDLAEVFVKAEAPDEEETPHENVKTKKKSSRTGNGNTGFAVYEKINVPGMIASKNLVSINTAAAGIILNDSRVFCGDSVSVSEVTEKLSAEQTTVKRNARFPEFFGDMPENESAGEETEE